MHAFPPAWRNSDARWARPGRTCNSYAHGRRPLGSFFQQCRLLGWLCTLLLVAFPCEQACLAQPFSLNDIVTLKCTANNSYVTVQAKSLNLTANRPYPGLLQEFTVVDGGAGSYALQARYSGDYVSAESAGAAPLVANRTAIGPWEQFDLVDQGGGDYALRARVNNQYVTASQGNLVANQSSAGNGLGEVYRPEQCRRLACHPAPIQSE